MAELVPILKSKILEAQQHTKSNAAAARWLGESYERYKRYAELYGVFAQHLNVKGVGISKGFATLPTSVKLKDIFAGNHLTYPMNRLKRRMIKRGLLLEQCTLCGFQERRISDGRLPLILTFKDGNKDNMSQENLHLLCYNCMFLTTGLPQLAHRRNLQTAMKHPHREGYPDQWVRHSKEDMPIRPDPEDVDLSDLPAGTLDMNTIATLQHEIQAALAEEEEEE